MLDNLVALYTCLQKIDYNINTYNIYLPNADVVDTAWKLLLASSSGIPIRSGCRAESSVRGRFIASVFIVGSM